MAFEIITAAPPRQKLILGVMVLAIIGAGGYFLVLSPKWADIDRLRGRHAALGSEIIQSRVTARNVAGFREEAADLRKRLDATKERLPSEKEIPTLYRQIADLASEAGLTVTLFQPREPLLRDVYAEVPILVKAEAGFHQVGSFFERLGRLPRIVTLTEMRIEGEGGTGTVRADLTLATYLLRPEGAPPPAPAKGGAGAPPAPTAARAPSALPQQPREPEQPVLPPKRYQAARLHDPFRPPRPPEGPKGIAVDTVKLVGILHGREGTMALVETPDGIGYILRAGDLFGNGRVTEIGSDSVIFSVTSRPGEAPRRVLLRLKTG